MKILCLHGTGLNSSLMQKQLSRIISALDPSYEFCFIDGEIEREASYALPQGTPGPFFAYYNRIEANYIREACDLIDLAIEDEGPFDGFIGFSQGAALGVSYMFDCALRKPPIECPFRWAMLFSCNLAFAPDPRYLALETTIYHLQGGELEKTAKGVLESAAEQNEESIAKTVPQTTHKRVEIVTNPEKREAFVADYIGLIRAICVLASLQGDPDSISLFDQGLTAATDAATLPKFYHPDLENARIDIPTVHCIGTADNHDSNRHSALIRNLCNERMALSIEHPGGHEIPRDGPTTMALVSALGKIIEDSRWTAPRALM